MEKFDSGLNVSKEVIASRMFRNAAKLWGYNDTEFDNFDPIVKLIIEACAVELYNINNEISNVQVRMLERLATLLTPEIYTVTRPSHAIMHARSSESESYTNPLFQFFYQKKIASKNNGIIDTNLDVYFSPVGSFKIFNCDIKNLFCNNIIYQISESQSKEILIQTQDNSAPFNAWIGLEIDSKVSDIEGLSLYFDFKNQPNKQSLFPLLRYIKIYHNNTKVDFQQGIYDYRKNKINDTNLTPTEEFKVTPTLERKIKQFYQDQFITLSPSKNENFQLKEEFFPDELEGTFSDSEKKAFKSKLYWFKLVFPPNFDQTILNEIIVSTNCFPIVNRKLNEVRYRLQSLFNIIPLNTSSNFLDINSVANLSGKNYYSNPVEKNDLSKKGTFAIRSSGVERFDQRNATDILKYLVELLRDESSAFAAFGQDFIANVIKELNENIGQIENKLKQNSVNEKPKSTFLFVKPYEENENIFVDFWTSNGADGNLIRSGSKMELFNGVDIQRNSLSLLTSTVGGGNQLKGNELLNAYKTSLLSRDRIVTKQDMINVAFLIFGKKLKDVEISKGIMISNLPDEGLVKTTDVKLFLKEEMQDEEEKEAYINELFNKLKNNSIVDARYRIFINNGDLN